MKHLILFLLFTLVSTTLFSSTIRDPYKNIDYFELDNGLKVYILADSQAVNTQINLEIQVGWSVEDEENAGITHLLEHIIFRDQRVKYHDYLDYLKEEGATYVNGYTREYSTGYVATIEASKSYFLVETFAQMIFDKNVTIEDLEIEKRALQTEIGELQWYHPLFYALGRVLSPMAKLYAVNSDIFKDSFELQEKKGKNWSYLYKKNNANFTLEKVLNHYKDYYYPSNMRLQIVGNFDLETMKKIVIQKYGRVETTGVKKSQKLPYNAKLSEKPYHVYSSAQGDENRAYIGARYLLDDYKKHLALYAYSDYLSSKMQKKLRNELGQTYSVNIYANGSRNAGMIGVSFDSLHDDFESNVEILRAQILKDTQSMTPQDIDEALLQSDLYYASKEHDSKTLMSLVDTQVHVHKYQNIYNKTPYEVFKEITPLYFQEAVSDAFVQKYSFEYLYRDYYLFPLDALLLVFILIGLLIFYSKRASSIKFLNPNLSYTHRDVILTRRLTPLFITIIFYIFIAAISIFIDAWFWELGSLVVTGDRYALESLPQFYEYLVEVLDMLVILAIYIGLSKLLLKTSYAKLELTQDTLNLVSTTHLKIEKSDIDEIKKVSWSIDKYKNICGVSVLFFKPLVMVKHSRGVCYLRARKVDELEEDLNKWLDR